MSLQEGTMEDLCVDIMILLIEDLHTLVFAVILGIILVVTIRPGVGSDPSEANVDEVMKVF